MGVAELASRRIHLMVALVLVALAAGLLARRSGESGARAGSVPPGCAATGSSYPPFPFVAYQPGYDEASLALARAGTGSLVDDERFLAPLIETGRHGEMLKAPFAPVRVLRALGYIESAWNQAELDVARGSRGPVLVSLSCAYGLTQVLSGMQHTTDDGSQPTPLQRLVGTDYRYNIALGFQQLVVKWNYTPYRTATIAFPQVGDRQPQFAESWYFAIWAYNGMSTRNNPANPDMPWPRPRYNSPAYLDSAGCRGFGCYPYQELVYDLAQYPPVVFGVRLWTPFENTLPDREQFLVPEGDEPLWPPPDIPLPSPAHQDRTRDGAPALAVDAATVAVNVVTGGRTPTAEVGVRNTGNGPMGWRASVAYVDASEAPWVSVKQSRAIDDGTVTVEFDTEGLTPGIYRATLRVDAPLSPGSPRLVPIVLNVTQNWSFVPGLARD